MLQDFGPEIWISDGPVVNAAAGFHFPTRMAIIRLRGDALFIWSPVKLTEELKAAVDDLGRVEYLVAPNSLHNLYVQEWQTAYPGAKTFAAPRFQKRCPKIKVDEELQKAPPVEWTGLIDQAVMAGNLITTEVVFFHHESNTAIFTDLLQQHPTGWFKGWRAFIAKLDKMTLPEPAVPGKFRKAFVNRGAAREALAHVYGWPTDKVLMAHGAPVETNGQAFLRRAFAWLSK